MVAAEDRREATANAPVIKLHVLFRPEGGKYRAALFFRQPAEVQFIMVAEEEAPLRGRRARFGGLHGLLERPRIGAGESIKQRLIDLEIEHHLHAVAIIAEIFEIVLRQDIGFCQDDGIAQAPLQEFAKLPQHIELFDRLGNVGAFRCDDEGAASILNPETPSWIQKPMILRISACTSGFDVLRSGW